MKQGHQKPDVVEEWDRSRTVSRFVQWGGLVLLAAGVALGLKWWLVGFV